MTRSENFIDGAERVRQPQFESVQQQANRNYLTTSVLDNVLPNQNGMGQQDLQRRMVGSQGAATGRSESTYDRQLWLRHQEPTARTKKKVSDE